MARHKCARTPVTPVDAAWLRMDSPTNAMVITTVLRFAAPLDDVALRGTLAELLAHRKFRQRAVRDRRALTRWSWEDVPDFAPERHVERATLGAPGDDAALEAFVSARMSTGLDPARPLWHIDVLAGLADGGGALVVRVHHAVGDGIALVRLLLGVTRASADREPVRVGIAPAARPRSLRARVARVRDQAQTLLRLLLLPPDPRRPLHGALGARKAAAMSGPIALERVRELARACGGHVNDVLAAAIAGALRSYLVAPPAVRAMVPVFIRSEGSAGGNHFGLAYLPLPVDEPERAARVRAVRSAMDQLKRAPDAAVAFFVLGAMGLASPALEKLGIGLFTAKASMLVTNVPGPAAPVQVAGQAVTSLVVWAPTSGGIGLGFSLLTYAGALRLGVAADVNLVPDPRALVACFERELEAMVGDAGLAPKAATDAPR